MCTKSIFDLSFNFFIAYGLSITHPLFVSVGTLLSTPLNVVFELCVHGTVPSAMDAGGMALIMSSFALILADDATRPEERAAPMAANDAAQQAAAAVAEPAASGDDCGRAAMAAFVQEEGGEAGEG
eukprot:6031065-Prymnesium_polylepis.1